MSGNDEKPKEKVGWLDSDYHICELCGCKTIMIYSYINIHTNKESSKVCPECHEKREEED